jgi:hypothetical protein
VTQDGTRTFPRNYSETSVGLALVAADAQGKAIMARDACGLGNPGADISPVRWRWGHDRKKPPEEWAWPAGDDDILGQPLDIPAATLWALIPGVVCDPVAVHLDYRGRNVCAISPDWLNKLGLEQMADRQVRLGVVAHLAGLDGGDQMANHELGPMCMALQSRALGWVGRVTATVEQFRNTGDVEVNWPGLDDIEVAEFSSRVMPTVSYGEPLFDNTFFPHSLSYADEEGALLLSLCERDVMGR